MRSLRVMLLLDPSREYTRALLSGIARYSRVIGNWSFIRQPPFWEQREPGSVLKFIRAHQPDGIIMGEHGDMEQVLSLGLPVAVSNYYAQSIPGAMNIVTDHEAAGRMAAEHLLSCGFKRFAFAGYPEMFWSRDRQTGFEERLAESGCEAAVYTPPRRKRDRETALAGWVESLPKPVGMMAVIDERSQEISEVCHGLGIDVPSGVGIIGVDNDPLICELSARPLTSVAISAERAGYETAEQLALMMAGSEWAEKVVLNPTHVVKRLSTDIINVEHPGVNKAIRFIREHAGEAVDVARVVAMAGMSRRSLERHFREVTGRSIHTEMRRARVAHIERMLIETNLNIAEIAYESGFPGVEHIARYFRAEKGMSPQAFRKDFGRK